jgi:hypothetical protein
MDNWTPWLLCCSIFGVLPLGAFGLGYYFGKYGVEIKVHRPEGVTSRLLGKKKKSYTVNKEQQQDL